MSKSANVLPFRNDVIQLDDEQLELFNSGCLQLKSPAGDLLQVLSNHPRNNLLHDAAEDAKGILHLFECLVVNQSGGLELNERATQGLADMLSLVQNHLDIHA